MSRRINQLGLDMIKHYEGVSLIAYHDIVGKLTIGYGHTEGVVEDQKITSYQAEELLKGDISKFEGGVEKLLTGSSINDNQFSALVCFAYNVGLGNLEKSTLLKFVNKSQHDKASDQFLVWDKAGGQHIKGLLARRRAERDLYRKPV